MRMPHPQHEFERLSQQAAQCTTCPNMINQSAVLGPGNGSIDSDILFVAEAPGRFGGARTGIPFSGDKSGDNFEALIAHIGLTRQDIFVTNAVLCNPLANGNERNQQLFFLFEICTGADATPRGGHTRRRRTRRDQPDTEHPLQIA